MAMRVSAAERIECWGRAERAVLKYKDDHFLWHKEVHNVELDAIQLLKCAEMDRHLMTLDFSSRRMGKTAIKELYSLWYNATHADQKVGIVAPRLAQSITNINYHTEAIRRSEMLTAFVDVKNGRQQLADSKYAFANQSKCEAFGIMSNVDGDGLTCASLEEVDDMPHDRLFSRFLLMLGSSRRLGASKKSILNKPQVRITGVYKGSTTLVELIASGEYFVVGAFHGDRAKQEVRNLIDAGWLSSSQVNPDQYEHPVPIGHAINGMELGLLNRGFLLSMRKQLGEDEFARQLLCVNTASRNLIWEEWLQRAVQIGVKGKLEPVIPVPNEVYKKLGLISFGYDHSGHGEDPKASRSALVVSENLGGFFVPIFAKTWEPGADENMIRRDLLSFWKFFRPDRAAGDAYGIGLLSALCENLYEEGLTSVDIRTLGESTASVWPKWPFVPIRFEGMMKHSMASGLATAFSGGRVALPYVAHIEEGDEDYNDVKDLQWLYRQMVNIEDIANSKTYSTYKMVKRSIGDDLFDAAMAGHYSLMAGTHDVVTSVLLGAASSNGMLEYHQMAD